MVGCNSCAVAEEREACDEAAAHAPQTKAHASLMRGRKLTATALAVCAAAAVGTQCPLWVPALLLFVVALLLLAGLK